MSAARGFSLTELLVVIAIILILVSLLIVTTGEVYGLGQRVACQHKLEHIGYACEMFSTANAGRQLACVEFGGGGSNRWYEKLLPYLGAGTLTEGKLHLNCPAAPLEETSDTAMGAGRGQNMPILLYTAGEQSDYNRYYQLRDKLNAFWPGKCQWTTWKQTTNPDRIDDNWIWNQGGLDTYAEFWFFGVRPDTNSAFGQTTAIDPNPERLKEFRERGGGGLFLIGDHSSPNPDRYDIYNHGLNNICDHLRLGICICGGRPHNWNVTWSGHEIGVGLASAPGPATLPPGGINLSVGRVTLDNRASDERKSRQACVTFVLTCAGDQPQGGHGISYPAGIHEQPCGHIGVMDDGLGRVCVDSTFTRWYDSYSPFTDNANNKAAKMNLLAEQISLWLAGGRAVGGNITYGYNTQVGAGAPGQPSGGPAPLDPARTIRILDYKFYAADRDGKAPDDDATCIAPRHAGRANVLFVDGRVEALTPAQILDPKRNHWKAR